MNKGEILVVLTSALVTAALRFAPFILFPPGKKTPALVRNEAESIQRNG